MSEEDDCYYVSSRGILKKSSDLRSNTPVSSIPQLINYCCISEQKESTTIYICTSAMRDFMNNLSTIRYKFILITGDSDLSVPFDLFSSSIEFNHFIESEKVLHWYAQNCVIDHPKLTRIPIGLDYHTLAASDYKWGPMQTPRRQEVSLVKIKNKSQPFWERNPTCYSNFHFHFYKFGQDRKDAMRKIPKDLIFYEETEVPRLDSWEKQSQYCFVVSPHGNGLDCHRTWEALVLGCIVIVKTSKLDPLYEGLPVLIVNDWSDITKTLLEKTQDSFKTKTFEYERLTLEYWSNKIRTEYNGTSTGKD